MSHALPSVVTLAIFTVALGLSGCATPPSTGETGGSSSSLPRLPEPSTTGGSTGGTTGGTTRETTRGTPDGSADKSGAPGAGDESETATTSEERRAVLGRRLDDSLDEFDKALQEEQRRTAEERDTRTASSREAGDGEGGSGAASEGGRREGDLRSERSASTSGRESGGEQRDRGSPSAGSGAPDRSIPSGDDDDIVARRLRRAAEQETDPELKEKLWKEYVEYKRNVQGRG